MTSALVSVVVPVHNGERFLAESLEAILRQDYEPIELIVVDDGSTDASPEIVARYPDIHYIRQDNRGPSAARNTGIAASSGELLTFCDCDDVYRRAKVSIQVRHLTAHPAASCVLVRHETFVEPGTEPPEWISADDTGVQVQSAMVRRAVINAIGGYNPDYRMTENMEWLERMKTAGLRIDVLDDVVVDRRLHGTNLSYQRKGLQQGLLRSLRDRVHEKREAGDSA
jgi:glycosyltransferase involved in cell wall biosynthesis